MFFSNVFNWKPNLIFRKKCLCFWCGCRGFRWRWGVRDPIFHPCFKAPLWRRRSSFYPPHHKQVIAYVRFPCLHLMNNQTTNHTMQFTGFNNPFFFNITQVTSIVHVLPKYLPNQQTILAISLLQFISLFCIPSSSFYKCAIHFPITKVY